ncbi:hypothetical protein [Enterococcus faecium]|uniref:hypothetical protein n=1 Tax=Enterococcus faecium TaxID=1352 RepID=UPI001A04FB1C|nr:hypothetical protein [Enterococcus faecium]EGP4915085.1 hypothetical protein [Enterococcus faecium]EJC3745766.1 hypothetical protein [Enterococcus faecium]EME3541931.1 hypothetical protein [Enterococcus faecium]EME8104540.1 hypothetical protein [Enterococcus faecium]EME8200958.1 hypothetical protein [Enterococcus faecium]
MVTEIEMLDYESNEETKMAFRETKKLLKKTDLKNEEDLDSYFDRMLREVKEEHDTEV